MNFKYVLFFCGLLVILISVLAGTSGSIKDTWGFPFCAGLIMCVGSCLFHMADLVREYDRMKKGE